MIKKKIVKKIRAIVVVTLTLVSASLLSTNGAQAGVSSASTQATATLSSSCTISSQNLNFGNLVLPLSAQSASANMSVLCSKNHAYTIDLAYGGVYGQGQASSNYWTVSGSGGSYTIEYYGPSGFITGISGRTCAQIPEWDEAGVGASNTIANTGWTCGATGTFGLTTAYGYGKMIGVAKGDNIAYSIQVPNQPAQIWNAGESSYSATGTGASQTIPVVGTIVPSQSGSNYPTPDTYLDTVTATINF